MTATERAVSLRQCSPSAATWRVPSGARFTAVALAMAGPTEARQANCTFAVVNGWSRSSVVTARGATSRTGII